MTNISTIAITEKTVRRRYESEHTAIFDRIGNWRIFSKDDRMQHTLAECIYLHGIVSVNECQYIRTDYVKNMAYNGRRYLGNPVVPLDLVLDTLYSPLEDYADNEQYHLYTVNDYGAKAKPCIVGVSPHEVNIR